MTFKNFFTQWPIVYQSCVLAGVQSQLIVCDDAVIDVIVITLKGSSNDCYTASYRYAISLGGKYVFTGGAVTDCG